MKAVFEINSQAVRSLGSITIQNSVIFRKEIIIRTTPEKIKRKKIDWKQAGKRKGTWAKSSLRTQK